MLRAMEEAYSRGFINVQFESDSRGCDLIEIINLV
jgi:hypothetical protein